jgi:hypothetical protein
MVSYSTPSSWNTPGLDTPGLDTPGLNRDFFFGGLVPSVSQQSVQGVSNPGREHAILKVFIRNRHAARALADRLWMRQQAMDTIRQPGPVLIVFGSLVRHQHFRWKHPSGLTHFAGQHEPAAG